MKQTTVTLFLLLAFGLGAEAQRGVAVQTLASGAAVTPSPVPFGPGEKVAYRVTYGVLGKRGTASSEVKKVEQVRGRPTYHLSFRLRGGALGFSINDHLESWLDVEKLYSHRFKSDVNQTTYERLRTLDFYPAERRWRRAEKPDSGRLATDLPLDDVSFLYWARTLPLEVGRTYEFQRYFKDEGNPVTIRVVRKQLVTVPAGTFRAIVVKPLIKTSGMFGDGGEAEIYFTDDWRRLPVLVKTKMSIGTLQMQLENYTPGEILGDVSNRGGQP